ncbi:MAG: O-succinylhomoserine sulfhydrylase [Rhodospirillales bacterium]|nr:O-succinylhomoserine sulfhydrylase [Rhodospirillales bacterium]
MNDETKRDPKPDSTWRQATRLVRGGTRRSEFGETSEGLFITSGYIYPTAEDAERAFKGQSNRFIYSRYSNPTVEMLENRLCALEGATICRATASGMGAVFTSLACMLKAGDRLVASQALFGSCHYVMTEILPKFGIITELVDGKDLNAWKKALSTPTKAVFVETPSNPTLEIIDLKAVADLAHAAGARFVVDNVFATPILQKPMELGVDIVVYSTTKHMDGQGRAMGGAILTNDQEYLEKHLTPFYRHTGPAPSPFNSWVVLKGLETLELRVRQHCLNARQIAGHLEKHKRIKRTLYPALASHPQHALAMRQMKDGSTVITFEFDGGRERAFKFLNALRLIDISNNLGDAKSLTTHPATTTHQRLTPDERAKMGISDGMVRLSVGLEDPADIIDDLDQALETAFR